MSLAAAAPSVCVLVPVYRTPLAKFERASLDRLLAVLGAYPIVIVKPEALDLREISPAAAQLASESFPDRFFAGIDGYNQLMLSDELYARFARYEYALVHQLDAFVFEDRLRQWCERGYDYVGAPWIADPVLPNWHEAFARRVRRKVYRWIDRQARREPGMHYTQYAYTVGNGGFSLRRIAAMRNVLAQLAARAERYRRGNAALHHEDLFFCVEANRFRTRVSTPSWREAAHFAWELQPSAAATLTNGALPFGCHGWNKLHRDEWRPIFRRYGVSIDDVLG